MRISLLQLNIEEGKQMDVILPYLKEHQFDIIHFQEVTSGRHNFAGKENYPDILAKLGDAYVGEQLIYWRLQNDPMTYMSNATFYKATLTKTATSAHFLKPYADLTEEELHQYAHHPTAALDVTFQINGTPIHFINTHLVWGPTPEDKPYKVEQGKRLYEYIKSLNEPFVLSGDFNVTGDSQIVRWIDELGVNHAKNAGITNTLNPNTHRVKHLFPKGLAVDFLYTHPSLKTSNFTLVDAPDLSDHFGLSIEIEI